MIVAAALAATVGCASSDPPKGEAYCGAIGSDLTTLTSPSIVTGADIESVLQVYRTITQGAPVAVQPEWQTVLESLETASTVEPGDTASLQRAADSARRAQPAITRIQQYTQQICGLDIGVPPRTTAPRTAPTTTAPTTTTTAPTTTTKDSPSGTSDVASDST